MPLFREIDDKGTTKAFSLNDMPELESRLKELPDCKLVVIDPVSAFLGNRDSYKDAEVREILTPLQKLAEAYNVAIVLVGHITKSRGVRAAHKAMGSVGFVNAVRSAFYAGKSSTAEYALAHVKSNCAKRQPTLSYEIESVELESNISTSKINWTGEINESADDMIAAADTTPTKTDEARELLTDTFSDNMTKYAKDIIKRAVGQGISRTTLHRARKELGITSDKECFGGRVKWYPPNDTTF